MKILLRIIGIAARRRRQMAAAYACTAGAAVAYLYLPRLVGRAIDEVALGLDDGGFSEGVILSTVLLIFGVYVIRGILSFGQSYLGESLALSVSYDLRNEFYDRVQRLSFGFHDRYHTGNLMSRAIQDVENVRMFINMGLIRTPYYLFLFVFVSVLLLHLDLRLGLMSISFMPLLALQSGRVRLRLRRIWLQVQVMMAELNTVLQENLTGMRVVKAFASERYEEKKFDEHNSNVASTTVEAERMRTANSTFMLFTFTLVTGLILWYGGTQVIEGRMSVGDLAQFMLYMQILSMPVRMVGWLVSSYARAASSGERLFEVLDFQPDVEEKSSAFEMPRVRGHVRFHGVSFGYEGGPPVLKNIDLDVEPGEVIALLGAPGSGKTTIASLVPRFYEVGSGRITIDGMDVRDVSLASLRRNIGMVQQDVFLFTTSLRENIAYGREEASMDEIVQAARVAHLDDFIRSLGRGYDTVIGERGVTLSGGERQRLAIARAVLLDPPMLILDDSTSSVDAETEDLIHRAMSSVMQGRTTFVIAHRLSTVHKADKIVVLEDGQIVERGTHQELLALGGRYREIYELQLRPQEEVLLEFESSEVSQRGSSR